MLQEEQQVMAQDMLQEEACISREAVDMLLEEPQVMAQDMLQEEAAYIRVHLEDPSPLDLQEEVAQEAVQ